MAEQSIGDYTTTTKVRAIAGVTDNEVNDLVLLSMELEVLLGTEFYSWLPNHKALWDAGAAGTPTAEQKQIRALIGVYAGRFCALQVLSSSLHIPQQKSNGKDSAKRFSDDALESAKLELRDRLGSAKTELIALVAPPVTVSSGLFGRASPSTDPVTNS